MRLLDEEPEAFEAMREAVVGQELKGAGAIRDPVDRR
jgi:hypothetical protein